MTTTFENSVKVSFEFTLEELQTLYGALNSADVQLIKRVELAESSNNENDVNYYSSTEEIVSDFIGNFNPARYFNLKSK